VDYLVEYALRPEDISKIRDWHRSAGPPERHLALNLVPVEEKREKTPNPLKLHQKLAVSEQHDDFFFIFGLIKVLLSYQTGCFSLGRMLTHSKPGCLLDRKRCFRW